MALLEVKDLTKRFGGLVAVNGISLAVEAGEVRGLIGPNGSGKSTTMNLIGGLYRPTAGEMLLDGVPLNRLRPHQRASLGLVRTFQIPKSFGDMTVRENLLVPALATHRERSPAAFRALEHEAERQLAFFKLDHVQHLAAKQLSGGQSMLLQIARGLMVEGLRLFLMDEPFAGINEVIKETIMDAILRMNREQGITFLIVSHEMPSVRRLCGRVSVMHEGRLVAEGTVEEVGNDPMVIEAYLGGSHGAAQH
jgi:branched-chain amino acid transport system ATP-binding protein